MSADVPLPMDEPGRSTRVLAATWIVVAVAMLLLGVLSQRLERTPDERNYQLAGRALLACEGLHTIEQRFQGPLILLGTQLTDGGGPVSSDLVLRRARLGYLVFPAVLLVVLVSWVRRAFGERAGLFVAVLAASNPSLLAYGPLLSSDVAYTSMALLAAWLAWRWLQAPGWRSLLAFGVALGLLAATKYTAVLTAGGLGLAVLVAIGLGSEAWPRQNGIARRLGARLLGAGLSAVVAGGVALFVLYGAYLFAERPFPVAAAAELTSPALQRLAGLPLCSWLLGLLPEPLVRGVDYQAVWAGKAELGTFGDHLGSHVAYYPLTVLVKSPLPLLVAATLGVLAAFGRRVARGTWLLALLPPFVLLGYCSAARALQMGIRYVLPVVPALLMAAGAFAGSRFAAARAGTVVLVLLAAASLADLFTGWPHFVGFFNLAAGGSTNGYRLCADGNLDWDQRYTTGQQALRERHPDLVFLPPGAGPRFGKVAIYTQELKVQDPRDPQRTYHWLTRFAPFDHDGAAWLAFDVTPAAFERAVEAHDRRAAEDLALAFLREGDIAAARQALARLPAVAGDAHVAATASLIEAVAAAGDDPARRDAASDQLTAAGHFELALALADRGRRGGAVKVFWLLWRTGEQRAAVDFLEARGADGSRTLEEVALLADSLRDGGRDYPPQPMRALELMQRGPKPAADAPAEVHEYWRALQARVHASMERERLLEGVR